MRQDATRRADAAEAPTEKSVARYLPTAARVVMGLIFAVTGLNGFLNFLPQPSTPMAEGAGAFAIALVNTGYMMPLAMGTQVIVAALLLSNRFVPLALALVAPVVVNIVAFHAFLAPDGVPVAVLVVALEVYLAWTYRKAYRPMLAMRADRRDRATVREAEQRQRAQVAPAA
jgi:uncharacterized membrane protein YphA (DoxX/SURF4 family)